MIKKFGIIGNPIKHSLSPTLHNYWFQKYNINAEYSLIDINENEIKNVIARIKNKEISGKGNIILKTHGFNATSDNLIIRDYKLAYLKDNVKIKRNGSQISSNELIYN